MINFASTILIAVPILFSLFVSFQIFDLSLVPASYISLSYFFIGVSLIIFLIDCLFYKKRYFYLDLVNIFKLSQFQKIFLKYFVFIVLVFCVMDAYFHGIVFNNYAAGLYMTFDNFQRRIRHISSLVWTFSIFSYFVEKKWLQYFIVFFAIFLPIVFLDRGRLQFSLLSIVFINLFFKKITVQKIIYSVLIFILAGFLFSYLGKNRSGSGDAHLNQAIQNSYNVNPVNCDLPAQLPFSSYFVNQSIRMKWILVYAGVPFYNLQTQMNCNYYDSSILKGQLIPYWAAHHKVQPWPLVSAELNVATEFLPFILLGGYGGVLIAIVIMWGALIYVLQSLKKSPSIFKIIIFFKLATSLVFSMFSSLFFTWSNFAFLILFVVIHFSEKNIYLNNLVLKTEHLINKALKKLSFQS